MSQELDLDALTKFEAMHACCVCPPDMGEGTRHECCPHDGTFRALLREARAARKMREAEAILDIHVRAGAMQADRIGVLRRALADAEPWAHVVEDHAANIGAALVTDTPYPAVASMTPRCARSPQIAHADECPGCIARRALSEEGAPDRE